MRLFLLGLLLGLTFPLAADQLTEPTPLSPELRPVYLYLKQIERNHNNLVRVTSNPNGSRRARRNTLIVYDNSGSLKICINSSSTGEGTTWRCSANALTAP